MAKKIYTDIDLKGNQIIGSKVIIPTDPLHIANKEYVDQEIATIELNPQFQEGYFQYINTIQYDSSAYTSIYEKSYKKTNYFALKINFKIELKSRTSVENLLLRITLNDSQNRTATVNAVSDGSYYYHFLLEPNIIPFYLGIDDITTNVSFQITGLLSGGGKEAVQLSTDITNILKNNIKISNYTGYLGMNIGSNEITLPSITSDSIPSIGLSSTSLIQDYIIRPVTNNSINRFPILFIDTLSDFVDISLYSGFATGGLYKHITTQRMTIDQLTNLQSTQFTYSYNYNNSSYTKTTTLYMGILDLGVVSLDSVYNYYIAL